MDNVVFFVLAGLAGGFINGFAGTGTALFGLGFLLVALPPASAVAVIAVVSVISGLQGLWSVRGILPLVKGRIVHFVVPGFLGLPLGLWLLQFTNAELLRLLIALLLVGYGGYFGFRRGIPKLGRAYPRLNALIAWTSGVLGGLASLSGSLPAIWIPLQGWPKGETRAVMQSFNLVVLTITAVTLTMTGAFTQAALWALAVALPVGALSARMGIYLFHITSDDAFRRTLILLCLAMGLGLFASVVGKM